MSVLHIGAGNMYGGIETPLLNLANSRMLSPEMQPSSAFCFNGRIAEAIRESGAPVHGLNGARQ